MYHNRLRYPAASTQTVVPTYITTSPWKKHYIISCATDTKSLEYKHQAGDWTYNSFSTFTKLSKCFTPKSPILRSLEHWNSTAANVPNTATVQTCQHPPCLAAVFSSNTQENKVAGVRWRQKKNGSCLEPLMLMFEVWNGREDFLVGPENVGVSLPGWHLRQLESWYMTVMGRTNELVIKC